MKDSCKWQKSHSSHHKCKRHVISSWNWKVHFDFRGELGPEFMGCHWTPFCACVCVCVSVCLSHLLVGLLTVWTTFSGKLPLYGSCLRTRAVFVSHKQRALLFQLLCQSLIGPLADLLLTHYCMTENGVSWWLAWLMCLCPVLTGMGNVRLKVCAVEQFSKGKDVERSKHESMSRWGCWNLKDEQLYPFDALGCK